MRRASPAPEGTDRRKVESMFAASSKEPAARCSSSFGDPHARRSEVTIRLCAHDSPESHERAPEHVCFMRATLSSEQHLRRRRSCAAGSCATQVSHSQSGGDIIIAGWCARTGSAVEAFERESCGTALESEWGRLRALRSPAQLSSVQDAWMSYCQSFPLLPRGAPTPATTLVGQKLLEPRATRVLY